MTKAACGAGEGYWVVNAIRHSVLVKHASSADDAERQAIESGIIQSWEYEEDEDGRRGIFAEFVGTDLPAVFEI